MNYRLSWEPSNTKGFILASTIMAAIISFLLIGVICLCASHSIQYIEGISSSYEQWCITTDKWNSCCE